MFMKPPKVGHRPTLLFAESEMKRILNAADVLSSWGSFEHEPTVKSWNRVFRKLFAAAARLIRGGHPHRFRDTFAVSLLLKGVDLSQVSILLGHASIKITSVTTRPG
jgi:integrase